MSSTPPDIAHLVALIEAAKAEADRLGAPAAGVSRQLGQASAQARSAQTGGGSNEGVRSEDLTTDNDR